MFYLGLLLNLVGCIWIIVNAFRHGGVLWGIGSLICGPVLLVYGFLNFGANKIPLGLIGLSVVLFVIGGIPADIAAMRGTP